jgi:hypothetical protein
VYSEWNSDKNANFELSHTIYSNQTPLIYFFNSYEKNSFVIVSADDAVIPVLGYSFESTLSFDNQPINFVEWIYGYANQIEYVINNNVSATEEISNEWYTYSQKGENFHKKGEKNFYLLGTINWDQDGVWNNYCPGNSYVGCVATAAGMIMKYYEYPDFGYGSHSYEENDYGTLSANFGETTYQWNLIQNATGTDAAALLLFHIGVSVDMDYSTSGSGAFFADQLYSFRYYFTYSTSVTSRERASYTDTEWIAILKGELDLGRPISYRGQSEASGGHAFVCDGYNSNNYMHYNWGWSGYANGYFSVANLNPAGSNFTEEQAAGINIFPKTPQPLAFSNSVNNRTVTLTWKEPNCNKTPIGYNVYKETELLTQTPIIDTFFIENNVANGNYFYYVEAIYEFNLYGQAVSNKPASYVTVNVVNIDENNNYFSVFPNPTSNYIKINTTFDNFNITITDISGRNILSTTENYIDVSNIESGIYILNLFYENKNYTQKISIIK